MSFPAASASQPFRNWKYSQSEWPGLPSPASLHNAQNLPRCVILNEAAWGPADESLWGKRSEGSAFNPHRLKRPRGPLARHAATTRAAHRHRHRRRRSRHERCLRPRRSRTTACNSSSAAATSAAAPLLPASRRQRSHRQLPARPLRLLHQPHRLLQAHRRRRTKFIGPPR